MVEVQWQNMGPRPSSIWLWPCVLLPLFAPVLQNRVRTLACCRTRLWIVARWHCSDAMSQESPWIVEVLLGILHLAEIAPCLVLPPSVTLPWPSYYRDPNDLQGQSSLKRVNPLHIWKDVWLQGNMQSPCFELIQAFVALKLWHVPVTPGVQKPVIKNK